MYVFSLGRLGLAAAVLAAGISVARASAEENARINTIRSLYQQVNRRIARLEADPAREPELFTADLVVNSGRRPYPAVGTFHQALRFYYTFGDRERNPYPDRLIKVHGDSERSARKSRMELLFGSTGQLVFYFSDRGESDSALRLYYHDGRLVGARRGDRTVPVDSLLRKRGAAILEEAGRLRSLFRLALKTGESDG